MEKQCSVDVLKVMRDNMICGNAYEEKEGEVSVEIIWGDWKHEHRRLDLLIEKCLHPKDYKVDVTEEDGSDTYTAIHTYYF